MKNKKHLISFIILIILHTITGIADTGIEVNKFNEIKNLIYKDNWSKGAEKAEDFIKDFPKGKYLGTVYYWWAYCLNKKSSIENEASEMLKQKKKAVEILNILINKYPKNLWADDAITLRIEIASILTTMGHTDYKFYLTKLSNKSTQSLIALSYLLNIDKEKYFKSLIKILEITKNVITLKRGIMLLSRNFPERSIKILKKMLKNDLDPGVLNEAIYWIKKLELKIYPVQLQYKFYIGSYQKSKNTSFVEIPRNKKFIYKIDSFNKKNPMDYAKKLFGNQLYDIKLHVSGTTDGNHSGDLVREHLIEGFKIFPLNTSLKKTQDIIRGNIYLTDLSTKKKISSFYRVTKNYGNLIIFRKEKKILLISLQFQQVPIQKKSISNSSERLK